MSYFNFINKILNFKFLRVKTEIFYKILKYLIKIILIKLYLYKH